jgi:hypothetical protein
MSISVGAEPAEALFFLFCFAAEEMQSFDKLRTNGVEQ